MLYAIYKRKKSNENYIQLFSFRFTFFDFLLFRSDVDFVVNLPKPKLVITRRRAISAFKARLGQTSAADLTTLGRRNPVLLAIPSLQRANATVSQNDGS